jgi:hypothetical protein
LNNELETGKLLKTQINRNKIKQKLPEKRTSQQGKVPQEYSLYVYGLFVLHAFLLDLSVN